MRTLPILLLLIALGTTARSQTGIRFTVLDYEKIGPSFDLNALVGLDKDIGDGISIGIDVLRAFNFNGSTRPAYSTSNSFSDVELKRKTWGMQYRCMYFFSGSGYLASTIGFRRAVVDMKADIYSNSGLGFTSIRDTEETILIPVGLRLGFRGDPSDGGYGDIYAALGYNIGSGRQPAPMPYVDPEQLGFSKIWISVGYAYGIGW